MEKGSGLRRLADRPHVGGEGQAPAALQGRERGKEGRWPRGVRPPRRRPSRGPDPVDRPRAGLWPRPCKYRAVGCVNPGWHQQGAAGRRARGAEADLDRLYISRGPPCLAEEHETLGGSEASGEAREQTVCLSDLTVIRTVGLESFEMTNTQPAG